MADFNGFVPGVVLTAVVSYILDGVIRTAVHDGILEAHARSQDAEVKATSQILQTSQ